VSATTTGVLTTWSLSRKAALHRFVIPVSIDRVSASRDSSVLIIASGTHVSLYRALSNEFLVRIIGDFDVLAAEFTPDSRWIMIVGRCQVVFRQVSGGSVSHSHKLDSGSIIAIAAASGRLAVLNLVFNDDDVGHAQLYESGDAGYGVLWPSKGNLQRVLSR